jgi:hypothetical protein
MGFDQLRKHFVSWYLPSLKPILTPKVGNPVQSGLNLLHTVSLSKLRNAFNIFNNKMIISNKVKAISSLSDLLKAS